MLKNIDYNKTTVTHIWHFILALSSAAVLMHGYNTSGTKVNEQVGSKLQVFWKVEPLWCKLSTDLFFEHLASVRSYIAVFPLNENVTIWLQLSTASWSLEWDTPTNVY